MKKSNVTVSRYADPQLGWEACVRPDDGSWCLFIPRPEETAKTGLQPRLLHRVGTCVDEFGDTHDSYAAEGSPEHLVYVSECKAGIGLTEAFDESKVWEPSE